MATKEWDFRTTQRIFELNDPDARVTLASKRDPDIHLRSSRYPLPEDVQKEQLERLRKKHQKNAMSEGDKGRADNSKDSQEGADNSEDNTKKGFEIEWFKIH